MTQTTASVVAPTSLGLSARDVSVVYTSARRRPVEAVRGVSVRLMPGEVLGIVGESGSGKSSLARVLAGLSQPGRGEVATVGPDGQVVQRSGRKLHGFDGVQLVMQDSVGALNPRLAAWRSVAEAISRGRSVGRRWRDASLDLLDAVGITPEQAYRVPAELSGGQKQRVAIARALGAGASILVCDEIVSALDMIVRARIIDLLQRLRITMGFGLVFVSHDLSVVAHLAQRVAVMHQGAVVEEGPVGEIIHAPKDPYTRMLLDSVPAFDRER